MSKNIQDVKNNSAVSADKRASIAENSVLANEKRGFPFKGVLFGILIALVVLTIILFVINAVLNSYFKRIETLDNKIQLKTEIADMRLYKDNQAYFKQSDELHAIYEAALLNHANAVSDFKEDENVFNYAIYGIDKFVDTAEASADVIVIASVDKDNDHVTYFALETKMIVYIPYVGVGPLSDAYSWGEAPLLTQAIEQNYGMNINGYIEMNMAAFAETIDNFGNVVISGDEATVVGINEDIARFNKDMKLEGDKVVNKVKLKDGKISLNGMQSLAYIRHGGADKMSIVNTVVQQMTSKVAANGLGGFKTTLDTMLDKMGVSLSREDVGALVTIGFSVFEKVDMNVVGALPGRRNIPGIGITCDYASERVEIIKEVYYN